MYKSFILFLILGLMGVASCSERGETDLLEVIAMSKEYDQFQKELQVAFSIHPFNPDYDLEKIVDTIDKYGYENIESYSKKEFAAIKGGVAYLEHISRMQKSQVALRDKFRFSSLPYEDRRKIEAIYKEHHDVPSVDEIVEGIMQRRNIINNNK